MCLIDTQCHRKHLDLVDKSYSISRDVRDSHFVTGGQYPFRVDIGDNTKLVSTNGQVITLCDSE